MTNTKIISQLLRLAKEQKLKVCVDKRLKYRGCYYAGNCIVKMQRLDNRTDRVLTLAHELGHHLDYVNNEDVFCAGNYIPHQFYKRERIAWDHARKLLKERGFRYWSEYRRLRKQSLRKYKYYLDRNCLFEFLDSIT